MKRLLPLIPFLLLCSCSQKAAEPYAMAVLDGCIPYGDAYAVSFTLTVREVAPPGGDVFVDVLFTRYDVVESDDERAAVCVVVPDATEYCETLGYCVGSVCVPVPEIGLSENWVYRGSAILDQEALGAEVKVRIR